MPTYMTDTQTPAEITPKDLIVGLTPGTGQEATACQTYPRTGGKCK